MMSMAAWCARASGVLRAGMAAGVVMAMLAVPMANAAPLQGAARSPTVVGSGAHAPSNVPHDYVVTPNGYFHPSCVQQLAAGEVLTASGLIVAAGGRSRSVAACAYPHYDASGARFAPASIPAYAAYGDATSGTEVNGWIASGSFVLPRPQSARYISSNMSVPAAPQQSAGQTIYFFPGLEDLQHTQTIVQPVLAWNGFDDNDWTVASWNCCLDGHTWHSAPVSVATGALIAGNVVGSNCSGAVCTDWAITTADPANATSTTLNTQGYGQAFDWVFGAVMEVYGVSACAQFPADGTEFFTDIRVNGAIVRSPIRATSQPAWSSSVGSPDLGCEYTVHPYPTIYSRDIVIDY